MKMKTRSEKWVSGVLGVFCLLLLIHLIMQFSGIKAGASRVPMAARGSGAGRLMHASSSYVPDDLSRYDPEVHLDLLKKYQSRSLPPFEPNPFEADAPRPWSSPPPVNCRVFTLKARASGKRSSSSAGTNTHAPSPTFIASSTAFRGPLRTSCARTASGFYVMPTRTR